MTLALDRSVIAGELGTKAQPVQFEAVGSRESLGKNHLRNCHKIAAI